MSDTFMRATRSIDSLVAPHYYLGQFNSEFMMPVPSLPSLSTLKFDANQLLSPKGFVTPEKCDSGRTSNVDSEGLSSARSSTRSSASSFDVEAKAPGPEAKAPGQLQNPTDDDYWGWCINLDRREDRLKDVTRRAKNAGIRVVRFKAVEPGAGDKVSTSHVATHWETTLNARFDTSYTPGRILQLSNGERGCAMSHVTLWQKAKDLDLDFALILEDDILFATQFMTQLKHYQSQLPLDWDLMYLNYGHGGHPKPYNQYFEKSTYTWSTGAYLISRRGYTKLLQALPVDCPVDNFLAKHCHSGQLNAYVPRCRPLCMQIQEAGSDIEHTNTSGIDPHSKVANLIPGSGLSARPGLPTTSAPIIPGMMLHGALSYSGASSGLSSPIPSSPTLAMPAGQTGPGFSAFDVSQADTSAPASPHSPFPTLNSPLSAFPSFAGMRPLSMIPNGYSTLTSSLHQSSRFGSPLLAP